MELHSFIDHTILKADASQSDIEKICKEAIEHKFASVCVNASNVELVSELLQESGVKTCSVIGFPLGASTTEAKVYETRDAIEKGAHEIDMVINVAALKDQKYDYVKDEIAKIKHECGKKILKVIIETCYLLNDEKVKACQLAVEAGADFVKTSTGFGPEGATLEDVKLMKETVGDKALVKASGGIRSYETALAFVEAGAKRLGTSSGIAIVTGAISGKESSY